MLGFGFAVLLLGPRLLANPRTMKADAHSSSSQANGDHSPAPTHARVKQGRPLSPGPSAVDHQGDSRPPAPKRARKAINCEPCRNSKLKCDR